MSNIEFGTFLSTVYHSIFCENNPWIHVPASDTEKFKGETAFLIPTSGYVSTIIKLVRTNKIILEPNSIYTSCYVSPAAITQGCAAKPPLTSLECSPLTLDTKCTVDWTDAMKYRDWLRLGVPPTNYTLAMPECKGSQCVRTDGSYSYRAVLEWKMPFIPCSTLPTLFIKCLPC